MQHLSIRLTAVQLYVSVWTLFGYSGCISSSELNTASTPSRDALQAADSSMDANAGIIEGDVDSRISSDAARIQTDSNATDSVGMHELPDTSIVRDIWPVGDTSGRFDTAVDVDGDITEPSLASTGCGLVAKDEDNSYVQLQMNEGGSTVQRQFYLSRPQAYEPMTLHRLIVGLHGRDYAGKPMQGYLGLEEPPVEWKANEIFVYPDALLRNWGSWGDAVGWQLGPGAALSNAAGLDDNGFIEAMLTYMFENYCIDKNRVFVTGQSWGGDYTNVQACLLGDVFRAAVPVAANGIYYLTSPPVPCVGDVAVWPMHGLQDEYFPISVGEAYLNFWLDELGCSAETTDLGIATNDGSPELCVEYSGCNQPVRWCLYSEEFGHQIPFDYFSVETMAFFRSF